MEFTETDIVLELVMPTTCNTNTYPYTTSNCSGTLGGGSCSDSYGTHYKTCTVEEDDPCEGVGTSCAYCKTWDSTCNVCTACCDTSTYQYTSSNCSGTLSGSYCTDTSGTKHYTTCTETASDPCDSYTDQTCDYECASYYADCSSKCETCCEGGCGIKNMQDIANATTVNKNTCGYITSVKTCSSGYSPSGCSCTQDETCDFGCAFASSSNCPTGGTCDSITCGGETKYDLTSCSTSNGYQKNGCTCGCAECPSGSYKTTIDKNTACGSDPTGGSWMLTTPASGNYTNYSCGIGCAVCYLACNSGYEPNSGTGYNSTSCTPCEGWSSYLETCPDPYTCTSHKCQSDTRYEKTGCQNGYEWNNGNCTACTWPAKAISYCSSKDRDGKCTELSCGNQTKYMPNDCVDGYYLSGDATTGYECVACPSFTGDTTVFETSTDSNGCTYAKDCNSGYTSVSSSCLNGIEETYTASGLNGTTKTCYKCKRLEVGGGTTTDCSSYLTACPAHGVCTTKTCNGNTMYELSSCTPDSYTKSGNSCVIRRNSESCGYTSGSYCDYGYKTCTYSDSWGSYNIKCCTYSEANKASGGTECLGYSL